MSLSSGRNLLCKKPTISLQIGAMDQDAVQQINNEVESSFKKKSPPSSHVMTYRTPKNNNNKSIINKTKLKKRITFAEKEPSVLDDDADLE